MNKILSSRDNRYLVILEALYASEFLTLTQLAKLTKTSTRNTQNDIKLINNFIKPMVIATSPKEGSYLHAPNNYGIDYLYQCILTHSLEFSLIEMAFFEKNHNLDYYAETLFISLSTLKRAVKSINRALVPRGFSISTAPFSLIGNEFKICNFMYIYFMEAYNDRYLPFAKIQMETLEKLIRHILSQNSVPPNYPDLHFVKLVMMVSIVRLQNNHHTPKTAEISDQVDTSIINDFFSQKMVKSIFKLTLNEDVFYRLLYPFVSGQFAKDYQHLLTMAQEDPSIKKSVSDIRTFSRSLSADLDIAIGNEETLILELFNTHRLIIGESYILYNKKKLFIEDFIQDTPHISALVYSSIQRASNLNREFQQFELEELTYVLITQWSNFAKKVQKLKSIRSVGLFMDSDVEHTEFISDILNEKYRSTMAFTPITAQSIKNLLKETKNFEFVVTNISDLSNGITPFVTIGLFPTTKDYNKIAIAYDSLTNKDKKKLASVKLDTNFFFKPT